MTDPATEAAPGADEPTRRPHSLSHPSIEIPQRLPEKVWRRIVAFQFIYSMFGLLVGLLLALAGVVLFLRGVSGASSWTTSVLGLQSEVTDAAPGTILFLVGVVIVFLTRFVVKAAKPDKAQGRQP
jgi:hypothetical protein